MVFFSPEFCPVLLIPVLPSSPPGTIYPHASHLCLILPAQQHPGLHGECSPAWFPVHQQLMRSLSQRLPYSEVSLSLHSHTFRRPLLLDFEAEETSLSHQILPQRACHITNFLHGHNSQQRRSVNHYTWVLPVRDKKVLWGSGCSNTFFLRPSTSASLIWRILL